MIKGFVLLSFIFVAMFSVNGADKRGYVMAWAVNSFQNADKILINRPQRRNISDVQLAEANKAHSPFNLEGKFNVYHAWLKEKLKSGNVPAVQLGYITFRYFDSSKEANSFYKNLVKEYKDRKFKVDQTSINLTGSFTHKGTKFKFR